MDLLISSTGRIVVSEAPAAGLVVFTWLDRSSSTSQPQLPTPRAALCQLSCAFSPRAPRSAFSWILDNEDRRGHRRRVPKKGNTGNRAEGGLTQKSTVPAGAFSRPAQSPGEGKVPFVLPRLPDARACDREIRLSVARPLHNGPGDRDRVCNGVASPLHQSSLVGQIVRVRRAHDRSRECAA